MNIFPELTIKPHIIPDRDNQGFVIGASRDGRSLAYWNEKLGWGWPAAVYSSATAAALVLDKLYAAERVRLKTKQEVDSEKDKTKNAAKRLRLCVDTLISHHVFKPGQDGHAALMELDQYVIQLEVEEEKRAKEKATS